MRLCVGHAPGAVAAIVNGAAQGGGGDDSREAERPGILGELRQGERMRGVKYLYNAQGERTAVLIDLERNRALWEDLFDVALARTRATEPSERWTTIRRRLERRGRLKPAKATR